MTETPLDPSRLVLGVDGGGTTTVAWLAVPDGRVVGKGLAGPSNAKAVGDAAARSSLGAAIARAYVDAGMSHAPVAVACLGLAGFDRPDDRDRLARWSREEGWATRLLHANDGDLVVAAGTPEGWGVGVIAGTGSIAVGRSPEGKAARAGGWGHLIGDEGSAYAVALEALRCVVRRADGREPRPDGTDPLTEGLCRALGADGPSKIVSVLYAPGFDRARVAALAPEVIAAAAVDPGVEARFLQPAGEALAKQVGAVARALGFTGELPLAMAGGFLLGSEAVSGALLDRLVVDGYHVAVTRVAEPVRGAVLLAGRAFSTDA